MMAKTIKKILALLLAFLCGAIAGICTTAVLCEKSYIAKDQSDVSMTEQLGQNLTASITPTLSKGISLMSTVIPTAEYTTYGVSAQAEVAYTLTATVNPSTATNKKVDWSVSWIDPSSAFASGKTVTDYVTVVPTSDGSTTATVTCYQAFEGEILVTVMTREGGFQGDCIVTFAGVPSSMTITSSTLTPISSNTYGLGVGVTYDFDINLDNAFGVVGEKYHDYSIGFLATGTLTVGTFEDDPRGSETWYDTRTADLSEFASDIISYNIEGDVLHVTFNKSVDGYYSSMKRNGSVKTYYDRVKSVDSPCSFLLQISTKELGTDLQARVNFVIDSSVVTGVSVSSTLEF